MMDKNEILHKIIQDDGMAKVLLDPNPNFLDYAIKEEERKDLIWSVVFPNKQVVPVQDEAKSYVTMEFFYSKGSSSQFRVGEITFYVFCHQNLVRTDYGLRYDFMAERMLHLFEDARSPMWMGRLECEDIFDIDFPTPEFMGMLLRFKAVSYTR